MAEGIAIQILIEERGGYYVSKREKIIGGLWGAVVGDSIGVPVEFQSRESLRTNPVTNMRGYGTHGQPPGTWSDDSSLMLCTVEALKNGFNPRELAELFERWLNNSYWTPWGEVFDVGITTRSAIRNFSGGADPESAGPTGENSNGNGSLMRILPVAIQYANLTASEIISVAHRISALTHGHPRSQIACGLYCLMVRGLLSGLEPEEAYKVATREGRSLYSGSPFVQELSHFERVFSDEIGRLPESDIRSSGYVIHTLEASIWCFLNSESFPEATLLGVNLGEDTDTTGIAVGGLAGIFYGKQGIPEEWLHQIARRSEIDILFEDFQQKLG